jgi:hypothetical protein
LIFLAARTRGRRGGFGGPSLSQTRINTKVPNPTALSFADVSDGLLSFYVSTAGRERAYHLTFDLEASTGVEAGLPAESISPAGSSSPEAALSQATTGSVQQVLQPLSLSGSTLDLATSLLTVSALSGNFEGESSGTATTIGTIGLGQPLVSPGGNSGASGPEDPPGEIAGARPGWQSTEMAHEKIRRDR